MRTLASSRCSTNNVASQPDLRREVVEMLREISVLIEEARCTKPGRANPRLIRHRTWRLPIDVIKLAVIGGRKHGQ